MKNEDVQVTFKLNPDKEIGYLKTMVMKGIELEVDGMPILIWATKNGHTELVLAIGHYTNIGCKIEDVLKALFFASRDGHTEIVKILINIKKIEKLISEATYSENDKLGYNNIIYGFLIAVEGGHTEIVKLYIDAGIDVSVLNNDALYNAAKNGHTNIFKRLIKAKSSLFQKYKALKAVSEGITLSEDEKKVLDEIIYGAVEDGHTEIVRLFLKEQKNLYEESDALALNTILVNFAAQRGHTQIVELLVDAGVDINSKYLKVALEVAIRDKHIEIEQIIRNAGVTL